MFHEPSLFRYLRRIDRAAPVTLPRAVDHLSEVWFRRGPRTRAAVTLGVLTLIAVTLAASFRPVAAGPVTTVWTSAEDLSMGTVLGDQVIPVNRPVTSLPVDAVTDLDRPTGRLTAGLFAGEVVTDRHLTSDLSGLLRPGEVAVPVHGDQLAPVPVGIGIDVLSISLDGSGQRLTDRGRTIAVDGAWLWLAVPTDVAAAVAAADATSRLSLARQPPS